MKYFVAIKTVFPSAKSRTIENLAQMYCEHVGLKAAIADVIGSRLSQKEVAGKNILIKPNWVRHSEKISDEICLRTNDRFLLAATEVVLEKGPAKITLGDAPIQGCKWDRMLSPEFIDAVSQLREKFNIPIQIADFRRAKFDATVNNPERELVPLSSYVIFDLGKESYLEPISRSSKSDFRVTNYNPDILTETHLAGMHKYCIAKAAFDADIVISMPKIKTHQKTGITGALKNIVGINGDKDFLPHHRLGGTGFGGDCYPGKNYLRYWAELALDVANRNQGRFAYRFWCRLSSLLWYLSFPDRRHHLAAGWHGNDTTWRMVLDLNKIMVYGKPDGTLAPEPMRVVFSLCDGIVGGQGNGPLDPDPLPLGVICFSNYSPLADVCMGKLVGLDISKVSLLNAALDMSKDEKVEMLLNGECFELNELDAYSIKANLPDGWTDYLNVQK